MASLGAAAKEACRLLRRHRRAVVIGSLGGAVVYGYWRVQKWLGEAEEWKRELRESALEQARYDQYLRRAKGECLTAIGNFLPTLRKRLFAVVDVSGPVRELKQRRSGEEAFGAEGEGEGEGEGEHELWERVKVSGLTRMLVAYYSFTALNLMLRMQMHILGRKSLQESLDLSGQGVAKLSLESRYNMLAATYEYMLGEGLERLAADVSEAVTKVFASWHMKERVEVGSDEFVNMLVDVRLHIGDYQRFAGRYLIRPDVGFSREGSSSVNDASVLALLNETWDTVESPNFGVALHDSLDAVFALLCRRIRGRTFALQAEPLEEEEEGVSAATAAGAASPRRLTFGREARPALATVVSQLKKFTAEMLEGAAVAAAAQQQDPPGQGMDNRFVHTVGDLPAVDELCCLVFGQSQSS